MMLSDAKIELLRGKAVTHESFEEGTYYRKGGNYLLNQDGQIFGVFDFFYDVKFKRKFREGWSVVKINLVECDYKIGWYKHKTLYDRSKPSRLDYLWFDGEFWHNMISEESIIFVDRKTRNNWEISCEDIGEYLGV